MSKMIEKWSQCFLEFRKNGNGKKGIEIYSSGESDEETKEAFELMDFD